ncbi:alpha-ketoglutarate-dependent dioxygenase AlkB [Acidicapsa acidisoli]|uniref:alpha-ketoglutarate-dependent dioxygenase AlkB n=1 Tax=Acidicapsa acidisoli TaxID=1615681 RepID=UPI0021DF6297|nr:alpha-ketoglutarate-dependent dioxygenase AlkB [Acidicapsa acidisoli]
MNLFSQLEVEPTHEEVFPGAVLMRGLALPEDKEFFAAVETIIAAAPLHHAVTPSGLPMGVMVTDCGDPRAFANRWDPNNPQRVLSWPPMPRLLYDFAIRCAVRSGFPRFRPDACHVNRYQAGTKLGLHQDRHECDLQQPIVSVSFGLECIFLLGGLQRIDKPRRILLEHGDVIVWGGPSRMRFHGVQPLKPGCHPLTGPYRYNLTFRKIA